MEIRKCCLQDCDTLARLNQQLIEDEGHDNPMNETELRLRMEGFLRGEYEAFYFIHDAATVGYALVKTTISPFYLRQFFICREQRRKGYGTLAFRSLLKYLHVQSIDIEVLAWNETGRKFWESLGFQPRSISMRYSRNTPV